MNNRNGREELRHGRRSPRTQVQHLFTSRPLEGHIPSQETAADAQGHEQFEAYSPNETKTLNYQPNETTESYLPNEANLFNEYVPNEQETIPLGTMQKSNDETTFYSNTLPNDVPEDPPPILVPEESETSSFIQNQSFDPGYYQRPTQENTASQEEMDEPAFAPPPVLDFSQHHTLKSEPEPQKEEAHFAANIYRPRDVLRPESVSTSAEQNKTQQAYHVQKPSESPHKRRRKKRLIKRIVILSCILTMLGVGAYLGREWLSLQITSLTGRSLPLTAVHNPSEPTTAPIKGFDPAPAIKISEKAQMGIAAVSGTMAMETIAITGGNIATRTPVEEGLFDYYLFAASDGRLTGYYEALPEDGFAVQPGDSFYVAQPPWLVNNQGKALIPSSRYAHAAGENAKLGPLIGGWSIIEDEEGNEYNYINAEGKLLSTLWFSKAFPFTGNHTLAYVDSGNLAATQGRYTLYVLSNSGDMTKWMQTADMNDVVGCACDYALLNTGDLVTLSDLSVVCLADEVIAYLDCEALAVRERETGKYGLLVDGEQHYAFIYDSILPVACEIRWKQVGNAHFMQNSVTGMQYPQPLSHYFTLQREDAREMVALSTSSVYPILQ